MTYYYFLLGLIIGMLIVAYEIEYNNERKLSFFRIVDIDKYTFITTTNKKYRFEKH